MTKGALRETGLSHDEIMGELEGLKAEDLKWRGGSAFSYVYHAGDDIERVGKEAYMMYLSENGLDPTVFKSLLKFDTGVVAIGLEHLNAPEGAVGNFTSGGTESIICAVKAARNYARKVRGIAEPNIIIPVTAHAAFHKAAHYLDMECRIAPVDTTSFKADVDAMAALIDENTALIVGSAASYAHGVIDPITELGQPALERGVLLHVDGCIGAWLLPYFARLGGTVEPFDFSVPGVTSISMDYHKYAYCPKGASVVLYRDAAVRHHQIFSCADWSGYTVVNAVVQSSLTLREPVVLGVEQDLGARLGRAVGAFGEPDVLLEARRRDRAQPVQEDDVLGAEVVGRHVDLLELVQVEQSVHAAVELELGPPEVPVARDHAAASHRVQVVQRPEIQQVDVVPAVHPRSRPERDRPVSRAPAALAVHVARGDRLVEVAREAVSYTHLTLPTTPYV